MRDEEDNNHFIALPRYSGGTSGLVCKKGGGLREGSVDFYKNLEAREEFANISTNLINISEI